MFRSRLIPFMLSLLDAPTMAGEAAPATTAGRTNSGTANTAADAIRESTAREPLTQKPTICRMVVFHDSEQGDVPAVINEVTPSGEVRVCAFDPVFGPRNFLTSGQGTGAGQWSWPVRA